MSEQKILVSVKEAAAMMSIGVSTFWREVKAKRMPEPIKINGSTRWRVSDLQQAVAPANPPTTT